MERIKYLLIIAMLGILSILVSTSVSAANITVGDTGDYQYIQNAINNSNADDTIYVWAGVYNENVNVNKSVTIIGNSSSNTTIDGVVNDHVICSSVNWVNISRLNITDAGSGDSGIYSTMNYTHIDNCSFYDNPTDISIVGIADAPYCEGTIVDNCSFDGTVTTVEQLYLKYCNDTDVTNNVFENADYGIYIENSNSIDISNNTINITEYYGICVDNSQYVNISDNNIYSVLTSGIWFGDVSYSNITNCNITNIATSSANFSGIWFEFSTNNCSIINSTISYFDTGIFYEDATNVNNDIVDCNIYSNEYGVYLYDRCNNLTIRDCYIFGNTEIGVRLYSVNNILVYNNRIYNNIVNAEDNYPTNRWNTTKILGTSIMGGPYLGGNYWGDYTGIDTDGDGLGEIAYAIGDRFDYHPLANIFPMFTNLTVFDNPGYETDIFIFNVSYEDPDDSSSPDIIRFVLMKNSIEFLNTSATWVIGNNQTGANYTYSYVINTIGLFGYKFVAYDGTNWNESATQYVWVQGLPGHFDAILYINFYDATSGLGLSANLFKTYLSNDTTIDVTDRIYKAEYSTYTGAVYYYQITDYFDNKIYPLTTNYSTVVINRLYKYLDIPITWYKLAIKNMNNTVMHFSMQNSSRYYNITLFPEDSININVLPGDYFIVKHFYNAHNSTLINVLYDNITIYDDDFYIATGYETVLHIGWYNTNEGLGLPDETLRLFIDGQRQIKRTYYTYINTTLNVTVKDYYNFTLYQNNFTMNSTYEFIDLGLTFHSWLFGNKNDDYYMISLLKEGASRWWERGIVPYGEREFLIPSGNYTLRIYDKDYTMIYQNDHRIVNSKVYVIHGTNLTEIISGLSVIRGQLLELDANLDYALTPDIEIVTYNPPMVFSVYDKEGMAIGVNIYKICPALITIATTRVETTGNWINSTAMVPGNNTVTNGTVTILSDELYISGSGSINWINITYTDNGTLYQNTTYIPNKINFYGQNLTITASGNVHILRETKYNQVKKFYWTYYSDTGKHTAGIDIINSMNVPIYDVYVYVEFSNQSTPDPTTVVMRDVSNTGVVLRSGEHYDITSVGIHFYLLSISSDSTRGFTFEYYKRFDDAYRYGEETINVPGYTETVWQGLSFNTFEIGWINDEATIFRGGLFVKLDFDDATDINPSSIRIWDENNNHELNESDFISGSGFIRIDASGLDDINPGSGRKFSVYFLFEEYPGSDPTEIHLNTPIFMGVTPFLIILLVGLSLIGYGLYSYIFKDKKDWKNGIIIGVFVIFIFFVMEVMGV